MFNVTGICMFGSVWGEVMEMTLWTTVSTPSG
jgi:hypothetical protein